jgi:F-type H+-transporting ATPase subunit delta
MRGASRVSLIAAKDRLATMAAGSAGLSQLGAELFSVVGLLDSEPPLRRALADSSSARDARAGLVAGLLGDRVSSDTVELVSSVATSPWSTPADLADAIEQLAVLAVVTEADEAGRLDDLEDDLFRFARVLGTQPELRAALGNPFAPADAKRRLVDSLLADKSSAQTVELVTQAALQPRGRSLDWQLEEYARLAAEHRERLLAEVRVATDLSDEQRGRLVTLLSRAYGHDVHLNLVLDTQVIGGMIVRIGGEQIDASVATRLAEARRGLTA